MQINQTPPNEPERRYFPVEVRAAGDDGRPTIEGYAAVFNQLSGDLGGFVEIIEPGFFDNVLKDDVRSLKNHNPDWVLGRTASGTLEIIQDDKGLYQRTYPPVVEPDVASYAADLMVNIKRGDVTQQSFAFTVKSKWAGDEEDGYVWETVGDLIVRRLLKGGAKRLYDVSPVTYPAYPQTDVSAQVRSQFESYKAQTRTEGQPPIPPVAEEQPQQELDTLKRRLKLITL